MNLVTCLLELGKSDRFERSKSVVRLRKESIASFVETRELVSTRNSKILIHEVKDHLGVENLNNDSDAERENIPVKIDIRLSLDVFKNERNVQTYISASRCVFDWDPIYNEIRWWIRSQ